MDVVWFSSWFWARERRPKAPKGSAHGSLVFVVVTRVRPSRVKGLSHGMSRGMVIDFVCVDLTKGKCIIVNVWSKICLWCVWQVKEIWGVFGSPKLRMGVFGCVCV